MECMTDLFEAHFNFGKRSWYVWQDMYVVINIKKKTCFIKHHQNHE